MINVKKVNINNNILYVDTDLGEFFYDLRILSNLLSNATEIELNQYEISPSNYGIHWPLLNEDISIQALLKETLKEKAISE